MKTEELVKDGYEIRNAEMTAEFECLGGLYFTIRLNLGRNAGEETVRLKIDECEDDFMDVDITRFDGKANRKLVCDLLTLGGVYHSGKLGYVRVARKDGKMYVGGILDDDKWIDARPKDPGSDFDLDRASVHTDIPTAPWPMYQDPYWNGPKCSDVIQNGNNDE